MLAATWTDAAEADAWVARLDEAVTAATGVPFPTRGRPVGRQTRAPQRLTVTEHYAQVLRTPDGRYAVATSDPLTRAAIDTGAVPSVTETHEELLEPVSATSAESLRRALVAAADGGVVTADHCIQVDQPVTVEVRGHLVLRGSGSLVFSNGARLVLKAPAIGVSLSADVERGGVPVLSLDRPVSVLTGGVAETTWDTLAHDCVGPGDSVNFAHSRLSATCHVYDDARVDILGLGLESTAAHAVALEGMHGSVVSGVVATGPGQGAPGGLLQLQNCINTVVDQCEFRSCTYGVHIMGGRRTAVSNLRCVDVYHPVSPSGFTHNVHVSGLVVDGCQSSIDSHPAFDVHYRAVRSVGDAGPLSHRSVGGSLRDVVIDASCASGSTLMQNVALVDPAPYQESEFVAEDVEYNTPNSVSPWLGIVVSKGNVVTFRRVTADVLATEATAAAVEDSDTAHLYFKTTQATVSNTRIDSARGLWSGLVSLRVGAHMHATASVFRGAVLYEVQDGTAVYHDCVFEE